MNKTFLALLLLPVVGAAASELTSVDEPEKDIDPQTVATLKSVGMEASFRSSQRVFSRDGTKVAALIRRVQRIGDTPPVVTKFVQFFIDADNWIEINLGDPKLFTSHFAAEVTVVATADSITVAAPTKNYGEVFYKSNSTFMDGLQREGFLPGYLSGFRKTR